MELAIVGLVVASVLALMYFTRKKEVKPPVDEPDFFDGFPEYRTPGEIISQGAVDTSKDALEEAQQVEIKAELDQNAVAVRDYEKVTAQTQEQSILEPTVPEYSEIAAQKEAEAREARARLEAQWNLALTNAQSAMTRAEQAASDAWGAFYGAYTKVAYWEKEADKANEVIQRVNVYAQQATTLTLKRAYLAQVESWRDKWEYYKRKATEANNVATRIKVNAVHAISNANDCVERVLTITADIRLLGILLSLCDRADAIAKATRTKLGELQSKMSAMAL